MIFVPHSQFTPNTSKWILNENLIQIHYQKCHKLNDYNYELEEQFLSGKKKEYILIDLKWKIKDVESHEENRNLKSGITCFNLSNQWKLEENKNPVLKTYIAVVV